MSSTVHCSIRGGSDGVNIVKSVEIRPSGEGGYLANLSTQLRQLQKDVNATLTELVDKEKSRAQGTNVRRGIKPFHINAISLFALEGAGHETKEGLGMRLY